MADVYAMSRFVKDVKRFQPFDGEVRLQIQRLLTGKNEKGEVVDVPREVISPAQLFEQRLRGEQGDRSYLRANSCNTSFCVVSDPDLNEIKLVPRFPPLYFLNDKTRLVQGAISVSQDQYQEANGLRLTSSEIIEFRNNPFALPKRREEIFEFAAEGDIVLATEYRKNMCASLRSPFGEVMGFYFSDTKGMRLLCVGSVDVRSLANGSGNLGSSIGRLVGVVQNELTLAENGAPNLETVIR